MHVEKYYCAGTILPEKNYWQYLALNKPVERYTVTEKK
jgi:hypothetical protein